MTGKGFICMKAELGGQKFGMKSNLGLALLIDFSWGFLLNA